MSKFEHLTIEKGLSQSSVMAVMQDKQGFMWFSTQDGLNRYDGHSFKIYRYDFQNPHSVANNFSYCLLEDSRGLIWVGTYKGLSIYDRRTDRFTNYLHIKNAANSLPNNFVYALAEDKSGNVWIGTENGLAFADKKSIEAGAISFKNYRSDPEDRNSLPHYNIQGLAIDKRGRVWVASNGNGLAVYNPVNEKFYNFKNSVSSIKLNKQLNSLHIDRGGNLWMGTSDGLYSLPIKASHVLFPSGGDSLEIDWLKYPLLASGLPVKIKAIKESSKGVLWVGTDGSGIFRLSPDRKSSLAYEYTQNDPYGINNNRINSIWEDNTGILWLGSFEGGVNKLLENNSSFITYKNIPENESSINYNVVRAFAEDTQNKKLWVGTGGGGLNLLDRATGKFEHYVYAENKTGGLASNDVRALVVDSAGNVWIGTNGKGIDFLDSKTGKFKNYSHDSENPASLANDQLRRLFIDSRGDIWAGTWNGGLDRFNPKTMLFEHYVNQPENPNSLPFNSIGHIFEDSKKRMWFGTFGGGLALYQRETNDFKVYRHIDGDTTSLSHDRVNCIYEDEKGVFWIATYGGGLNEFNPETGVFNVYTEKDGLSNDVVYSVLPFQNKLWMSTNRGVSCFDKQSRTFKVYSYEDGLQSNEFNTGAYLKLSSGELCFGGINGFNIFHPDSLKQNDIKPNVVFTDFKILNKEVPIGPGQPLLEHISTAKDIQLSYKDNVLYFEFAALSYLHPEKNSYAYFLEGFEQDWNYVGNRRNVTYTNIPPGNYILHVKASNNDKVWNEEGVSVNIVIHPPFTQTWLFRLSAMFIAAALLIAFYKWRIQREKTQKEYLRVQIEVRTMEVVKQKEEIEIQNAFIRKKNDDTLASLHYAKRIQTAILPQESILSENLSDHFVFFKPRDIVSGDFYWFGKVFDGAFPKPKIILAAVDCTGHGVPGAFMSMAGNAYLNLIIKAHQVARPDIILNELHKNIREALRQDETENKDGMDMAVVSIDLRKNYIDFAGAKNPLVYIQNGEMFELKGDKMPIGGAQKEAVRTFSKQRVKINVPTYCYLFSDGFADQFGGEKDTKYMKKKFKELLLAIHEKPMAEQKEILEKEMQDWMMHGKYKQLDDMLVIGFKVVPFTASEGV